MNREEFLEKLDANDFAEGDDFWIEGWEFEVTGRQGELSRFIK